MCPAVTTAVARGGISSRAGQPPAVSVRKFITRRPRCSFITAPHKGQIKVGLFDKINYHGLFTLSSAHLGEDRAVLSPPNNTESSSASKVIDASVMRMFVYEILYCAGENEL